MGIIAGVLGIGGWFVGAFWDLRRAGLLLRGYLTETQRETPRRHCYQASLTGLGDAAKKLGEVGAPLLDLVEKLKNLLEL